MFRSTGIIFTLFLCAIFFIIFHPQIIDSLLANSNFLLNLIIEIVGLRPCKPGIAEIVISDLFLNFNKSKLLNIRIFFFSKRFFIFLKIFELLITNIFGSYSLICLQMSL